ncbi:hypothetical protein BJ944DRAFT_167948 [Cunninghamella echinulata]|nr:hypothetical protein BJ944DRAFT_167948 [Cunninghamella echinulata]
MANENSPLLPRLEESAALLQQQQHKKKEIIGLLLMALSAFAFSLMSLFVKISGSKFPSFEIVFARSSIQCLLGLVGCAYFKVNPLGDKKLRGLLAFRGLIGAMGLAFFFYSITQLPLPDATVLFFLNPLFTAILAAIFLGEAFTIFDMLCSACCVVGIILVSKPEFLFGGHSPSSPHDDNGSDLLSDKDNALSRVLGISAALVGALLAAIAYVTVRKIGKNVHFMVHVVYFGFVSTVFSILGMIFFQKPVMPTSSDSIPLLLVGLTAFLGQCLLNKSLQLAAAGKATLVRMNDVFFAFLLSITVLHEVPDIYSTIGSLIIVLATTSLGLHRWLIQK